MSIIITGLKMPTERENFNLTIKYNGTVLDTETGIQVAEVHELPPHGRLIDADAFIDTIRPLCEEDKFASCTFETVKLLIVEHINNAPTIIEAEEGVT